MADTKSFLKLMGMLESSGGKNTNHRVMREGMHKGQAAIGDLGLMPNTIKEVAARKVQDGSATELDQMLADAEPEVVADIMSQNPDKYKEYSEQLAGKVLDKASGDPATAAAGWLYGHNKSGDEMKESLNQDPEYKARIEKAIGEGRLMNENPGPLDNLTPPKEQMYSAPPKPAPRVPKPDEASFRQGTGKEQPGSTEFAGMSYPEIDQMNQAMENATGMVGGIAKVAPKALSAAEALLASRPARELGETLLLPAAEQAIGKVKMIPDKIMQALGKVKVK